MEQVYKQYINMAPAYQIGPKILYKALMKRKSSLKIREAEAGVKLPTPQEMSI
jgi:hypothetical protein